ncbi:metallophosphoesterase [Verrucomicrobium sp. BvORR106]|uniref:metallophosphoesterase n=1 Tax=Verrucomicrobium sp. BvORR106 TaxID=1403819 RepID=UPI0005708520|nr:metallophosphoesterase [Verrucomicrobium sp. BvORR106]
MNADPQSPLSEKRRAFLKRFRLLAAPSMIMGGGATYGYSSLIERHRVTVDRHDLRLALGSRAPAKFRAVSLTDFHFDPLFEEEYLAEVVRRTNALKPDIIMLTGDYISATSHKFEEFGQVVGGFQSTCGVFACLGNHDHWHQPSRIQNILVKQGIDVLVNRHTRVPCAGGEVVLTGLQSVWGGRPNWAVASQGLKPDDRTLMLVHEPDYASHLAGEKQIVFQASGHTHGGQIRLPGIGALRLPSWGVKFQAGFYDVDNIKLYVNRGIGTIQYHVRFLCPPEIACFDVVNTDVI